MAVSIFYSVTLTTAAPQAFMRCARSKPEAVIPLVSYIRLMLYLVSKLRLPSFAVLKTVMSNSTLKKMLSLLIAQAVAKQLVANMKAKTKGVVDVEIDENERSLMFSLGTFKIISPICSHH